MVFTMTPRVEFVSYAETDPLALADRLAELVAANRNRLQSDFPQVVQRYGTPEQALISVAEVRANIVRRRGEISGGTFGAYGVRTADGFVGVATFEQRRLMLYRGVGPLRIAQEPVNGPMLALWLAKRASPQRGEEALLPEILRTAAKRLNQNFMLRGRPWTLVRPDHNYVRTVLSDMAPGFGGFVSLYPRPRDFSYVDGVRTPRLLYVAAREMHQLGWRD